MGNPYAPPGSRPPSTGAHRRPPQAPPHQRPPQPPAPRRPVDAAEGARALRWCANFALLVLAGLVALSLTMPWQAASMVFFVGGAVSGVLALRGCHRAGIAGSVPTALLLGLVATGLLIVVELAVIASWEATGSTQRCQEQALTVAARDACSAAP